MRVVNGPVKMVSGVAHIGIILATQEFGNCETGLRSEEMLRLGSDFT